MKKTTFSPLVAGTMTWGVWGKKFDENQMIETINCCLENGISTFDHADIYGEYSTEASFGNAFAKSKIEREKIQLISKCGIQTENRSGIKHYDYSSKHIVWSAEQSLKNLQTDYLDLLLLHRPSPLMKVDEIANAIEKLKSEGKILDFGVSNFTPSQVDLIQIKTKVNYNQIQFSVTHFEAISNGNLDYMQVQNIRPMAWNPLGTIFKSEDEQSARVKKVATKLANKYDCELDVILLAWILKHPSKILPVFGTTDKKRISKLMKATEIEMELQDWFAIYSASLGTKVA
jgi:predicted oxidoreductase